ncbi:hypothetical protein ABENE_23130 [Asticcacaulis benevestitus DSM 16100 = ATCC BAA-896]|uniref:Uncharacterized protein n=1 Tax=Asticcacaulis benevestitus DSM 16100 = ATCC BAA-896 TaxID=1121022 RepID=V4NR51_9CAUL|nr:hypothetical protein ABENE_23130 [Asticcacaulis benevestitus DSM 16100 = ATCC BAA-896]
MVRYLDRSSHRAEILTDLRDNKSGVPSWMCNVIDMAIRKSEQKDENSA